MAIGDRFTPEAVLKKIDEMQSSFEDLKGQDPNGTRKEKYQSALLALAWLRIEVLSLAFAKDRYYEPDKG
jgi:hypothetical protein